MPPRPRKIPPIPKRALAVVSEHKAGTPKKYEEYRLFSLCQKTWSGITNLVGDVLAETREQAWEIFTEKYGPLTDPVVLQEIAKGPSRHENFPWVDRMTPGMVRVIEGFLEKAMEIPERVKNAKITILPPPGTISPPKIRKPPPWVRRA